MANIKKLKANGQDIVPITHEQAVLDSNGVTLESKLATINNTLSRLENNSTPSTPSLEGNIKILTFGNYTIKYNETDDTLDFIYNGATDVPVVPPTEEVISLSWIDNRNINISGVENDDTTAMVTDYLTKENGYNYTINLTNVSSVKIYFFDSSKTFISRTNDLTVNSTDILIEFPENTSYFRIKSDKGTATVDNANNYIILKKNKSNVPTTEETVPLTWVVGNLSGTDGSETVQDSTLRSGFVTIEDNYDYSFYLDKALGDPRGVRVYFYDTNKTYISRTSGDTLEYTSGSLISIDVPNNAAYMRFKANLDSSTTLSNISTLFTLRKTKTAIVNSYVREGLSMYIDANDVATYGSVRDITENYTVTNNGVSLTSDKKYLNFVSTESDYLGTDFVPNLTKWSAEVYFQYTSMPTASQAIFSWGVASDNNIRLAYSSSTGALTLQSNAGTNYPILSDSNEIVKPHHLIITKDNGNVITYLDGVKSVLVTDAAVQSPHNGTLNIGSRYSPTKYFADMNLRTFRFYDGKVLSDIEALQNYNYEIKNNYVTEGLALYIDAKDAATQGSIRDITGKQNITNHGVSTTLDNNCLNFVASESDYIDCGFKPNLTQWSAEAYFYFTATPTSAETLLGWGSSGNRTAIAVWGNGFMIAINGNVEHTIMATAPTSLTHLVLTYNNGTIIAYVNGIKTELATNANVMTSQESNLMIGTKYSASAEFGNIHLKSLRFYDGKVLTDEEALQNYEHEINRDIIKPTWIYNKKPDSSTGQIIEGQDNACTVLIPYDSSYNYKLSIDTVAFFRVYYYDSSQSYIKNDSIADDFRGVITPPENTAYIRLKLARKTVEFADLDNHVILRKTLK